MQKAELVSDELGYSAEGNFQLSEVQISFSAAYSKMRGKIDGEKQLLSKRKQDLMIWENLSLCRLPKKPKLGDLFVESVPGPLSLTGWVKLQESKTRSEPQFPHL